MVAKWIPQTRFATKAEAKEFLNVLKIRFRAPRWAGVKWRLAPNFDRSRFRVESKK